MTGVAGRLALVTGAGRGIGHAAATGSAQADIGSVYVFEAGPTHD